MIISKIIGGLGNQMFQYAIAQSIALENKDSFKLDLTAFNTYELFSYRLDEFKIPSCVATQDDIDNVLGRNLVVRKFRRVLGVSSHYIEKERTIFDSTVFKNKNIYLEGYWQNEQYFYKHRSKILQTFIPKCTFSKVTENYYSQIRKSESISVHIRRGDYLKHDDIGVLPLSYYKESMEYFLEKNQQVCFYIFSNDIDWCKDTFKDLENIVFIDDTESEIADLWLMSHCRHNIIANSSFSWWGAWLNRDSNKIVVSPKQWMKVNPKNHKWVPEEWIQF